MYFISNFKHLLLLQGMLKLIQAQKDHLTFCHWNLNGLVAYDFIKVPLVEAFIATNNFDIIYLSETFLDSTITDDDDENIQINGYLSLKPDHPEDLKRGGDCIDFKESLPLIRRNDLTNTKNCLVTEINVIPL